MIERTEIAGIEPYMPLSDYQVSLLIRDRMLPEVEIAAHFTGHSIHYVAGKPGDRQEHTALGFWREWLPAGVSR